MFLLLHENVYIKSEMFESLPLSIKIQSVNPYFHGTGGSYYEITAPQAKFFGISTHNFLKMQVFSVKNIGAPEEINNKNQKISEISCKLIIRTLGISEI